MITTEQLAEWRKLCNEATPSPWRIFIANDFNVVPPPTERELFIIDGNGSDMAFKNARLIGIAVDNMPILIDEVERLRLEVLNLNKALFGNDE